MSKNCSAFIALERQYPSYDTIGAWIHNLDEIAQLRCLLPPVEYGKLLAVVAPSLEERVGDFQRVHKLDRAKVNDGECVRRMRTLYSDIAFAETPSDFEAAYGWIRNLDDETTLRVAKLIDSYNIGVSRKDFHRSDCAICNPSLGPREMPQVSAEVPLAPVESPLAPVESPLAPVETPVAPAETPLRTPVETPVAPAETPVAPAETPVAPAETPLRTPVESPLAPVEPPLAPAETPLRTPAETPPQVPKVPLSQARMVFVYGGTVGNRCAPGCSCGRGRR